MTFFVIAIVMSPDIFILVKLVLAALPLPILKFFIASQLLPFCIFHVDLENMTLTRTSVSTHPSSTSNILANMGQIEPKLHIYTLVPVDTLITITVIFP
jgi:hypothetical protein